jgi:AhpC/TSA family
MNLRFRLLVVLLACVLLICPAFAAEPVKISALNEGWGATPVPLLSDQALQAIKRYRVRAPDNVRALRAYFLVDEKGILRKQWLLGVPGDDIVFSSEPIIAAVQEITAWR